jgi:hypothetical protein
MKNVNEIRAIDYVTPEFFHPAGQSRPGVDGMYALAMALHLERQGVRPAEFRAFVDQLEASAGPKFWDRNQMRAARGRMRRAAALWDVTCPEIAELLMLASDDLDGAGSAEVFFSHLNRISAQHELYGAVREMNAYGAA